MSWQGQMSTIVRHLIDDLDPDNYTFAQDRIETSILVSAQLSVMNITFENTYTMNVETCSLSPDPTDADIKDEAFITLICLRTACLIVGSQIRKESGNAISIKDGPSAIDLRGVSTTLQFLYKDLCDRYETLLLEYRAGNSIVGQAVLGPYSPGSDLISRNNSTRRDGGYFT